MKILEDIRARLMDVLLPWQTRLSSLLEAEVLPRYRQLAMREQRLVLAASLMLPLMFVVFALILHIQDKQHALRGELVSLQKQAAEAQKLAALLVKKGGSGKAAKPVNILATVERLARKFKLRKAMTRIRPQPVAAGQSQRLMLQMKNAPYDQVIRFTYTLAEEHLDLSSMKIQQGESAGVVHVQMVIAGGGGVWKIFDRKR